MKIVHYYSVHFAERFDLAVVEQDCLGTRFYAGPHTAYGMEQLEPFCMRSERRGGAGSG